MHMWLQCKEIFPKIVNSGYAKKNGSGQWPKTSPNGSPAVQGEQWGRRLWGERSRGGGEAQGILPKLFGGTSHRQAGMPYVLVRWYLCHPFLGSRLGSVLQVATHLCPILLATCWSCFNMALFSTNICLALKGSKSFPRKLHSKRYFWNAKRACPLFLHLDEMHQMGHCHFCQFWQSFDICQGVFLRKIFIWFFLFKIIIKMEMLLEIVVCQDIRCSWAFRAFWHLLGYDPFEGWQLSKYEHLKSTSKSFIDLLVQRDVRKRISWFLSQMTAFLPTPPKNKNKENTHTQNIKKISVVERAHIVLYYWFVHCSSLLL